MTFERANRWWLSRRARPTPNKGNVNDANLREQPNLDRALQALRQGNQVLLYADEEGPLLVDFCRTLTCAGAYVLAWIGYVGGDRAHTVQPIASAGRTEYLDAICAGWGYGEFGRSLAGTAIRSGSVQVLKDFSQAITSSPWCTQAEEHGFRATSVFPLNVGGTTIGALSIYAVEPEAFVAAEVEVLRELADGLSFTIERLRDPERSIRSNE